MRKETHHWFSVYHAFSCNYGEKSNEKKSNGILLNGNHFSWVWGSIIFFTQKPDKLFERKHLLLKGIKCGVDSDRFDEENVLVIDKLVDYRYNIKSQWEVSDQHSSDVKVWAIWKV